MQAFPIPPRKPKLLTSPTSVRDEVEKLLAEMRAQVRTVDDLRDTVEIASIVRQAAFPEVQPSFVPALARATLLGAWVQYDARRA